MSSARESWQSRFYEVEDDAVDGTPDSPLFFLSDDTILFSHGERLAIRHAHGHGEDVLGTIRAPTDVYDMAISPDARWLAVGDDEVTVYELASGREVASFYDYSKRIGALSFSRNGRWLALGERSDDNARGNDARCSVHLRDLAGGEPSRVFTGHRGAITSVVVSPNDGWFASAGDDATVLIWDVGDVLRRPLASQSTAVDLEQLWADLAGEDAPKLTAASGPWWQRLSVRCRFWPRG